MNSMKPIGIILCLINILTAGADLPVLRSTVSSVMIKDGNNIEMTSWALAPELNPDVFIASLINGNPHTVTYKSNIDSISFWVEEGDTIDFLILWDGKTCYNRIIGKRYIPAAFFDLEYQKLRRGKIFVSIPPVYELVNVAIAMTDFGKGKKNFIYQYSNYYTRVMEWFQPFEKHPLITTFDTILSENPNRYARLKMNGNSFEFDQNGKIIRSKVFDRTGFSNDNSNTLLPYWDLLQSFSDESKFLEFYEQNKKVYADQLAFYTDSVGIEDMKDWLQKNFPDASDYDTYSIIFSPLVSYNQSSTWFESNGFSELQPHVNFPYIRDAERVGPLSNKAQLLFRGIIVFTEINHGYINPEAQKYDLSKAISNRNTWVDRKYGNSYYGGTTLFNEYMNWALISLLFTDWLEGDERDRLIDSIDKTMVNGRGFIKFKEFDDFLIDLYSNRKTGQTISDLYPQIIQWFETNN